VLHSGNPLDISGEKYRPARSSIPAALDPTSPAREGTHAVTRAVVAGALAVAVLNTLPGMLGAWRWYRCEQSGAFWVLLRVGQGSAITLALAVGSLAAAGKYSSESLFYLYALLPLAVAFVGEQLRVISAQTVLDRHELANAEAVGGLGELEQRAIVVEIVRRELGVMALSALVVVFLALRAAGTAQGF
jgi:hypothetical protein